MMGLHPSKKQKMDESVEVVEDENSKIKVSEGDKEGEEENEPEKEESEEVAVKEIAATV